jgi:hypothetical protein
MKRHGLAVMMLIVFLTCGAGRGEGTRNRGIQNAGGAAPVPTKGRFRVFILSGQSNMVGQGTIQETEERYRKPHDRIRVWYSGRWEYLVPARRFGPELSFAHALAAAWPEHTIGIIKVAVGGTGILAFVPDWKKEDADLTGDGRKGPIYQDILGCVRAARKARDFELAGFLWKQGGKDARNAAVAKKYLEHFEQLVTGLRKDTGVPALPVFIGTHATTEQLEEAADGPQLRAAMRRRPGLLDVLRAHNEASKQIDHCRTVIHGRLPVRKDGIHFDTEGQLALGKLFAKAVVDYWSRAGQPAPGPPSR